jgi:hypothetical protein
MIADSRTRTHKRTQHGINFAEMMTPDAEFDGQAKSGVKNEK